MALTTMVKVHPVVLFQIVDAYERRNADAHRVIGTLLGNLYYSTSIDRCECYKPQSICQRNSSVKEGYVGLCTCQMCSYNKYICFPDYRHSR
jgi:hypothetical protein